MVLWRTQLVVGRLQRVIVWRLRRDEATVEWLCTGSGNPGPNLDPWLTILDDDSIVGPGRGTS
jgi:hypothetical protein